MGTQSETYVLSLISSFIYNKLIRTHQNKNKKKKRDEMDGLCLKPGISGVSPAIGGSIEVRPTSAQFSAVAVKKTTATSSSPAKFSFRHSLRSFWPAANRRRRGGAVESGGGEEKVAVAAVVEEIGGDSSAALPENWILKILQVRSLWSSGDRDEGRGGCCGAGDEAESRRDGSDCGDCCRVDDDYDGDGDGGDDDDDDNDDEKEAKFDRDSFTRLLRRVSLSEAKLYAQMSYLGNIAYCISKIQVCEY